MGRDRVENGRVIVKLLSRKDAQNVLKEKHKLRSINLYDDNTDSNIKEKSLLIKAFAHTIGNFMVW